MTVRVWEGGAAAVKQGVRLTPGGTIESDDRFIVQIGDRILNVAAGGTTAAAVVDAIVAAWATAGPEFEELSITDEGDTALVEAGTAGVPFSLTVSTTEAGGGAADDQTFTQSTITANAGPYCWDIASNWSGGAVPVSSDDVVLENSSCDILYGVDQSAVTLASFTRKQSFTGQIGLPRWNANGYTEYRPQCLTIGATTVTLGQGQGDGPIMERYDFGTAQTTATVHGTGDTREERGIPACLLKGTHASNVLNVNRGDVGSAIYAAETATWATLRLGYVTSPETDANLRLGAGVTLTTIEKSGGVLTLESNVTTLDQLSGTTTIRKAAAISALNLDGGHCYYWSSGTLAAAKVGGAGRLDFRGDMKARTVSACELHRGGAIHDPARTVTWSAGIDLIRCSPIQVTLDIGTHLTLTPSDV